MEGKDHYLCEIIAGIGKTEKEGMRHGLSEEEGELFKKLMKFFESRDKTADYDFQIYSDRFEILTYRELELHEDSERSLVVDNAGGNSAYSEAISIEYFINVFKASQIVLETEVKYYISYKMVDFICTINQQRIGVSVTRAMKFANKKQNEIYTEEDGFKLLKKKIYGLIVARNAVLKEHSFYKSVLHIFCQTKQIVETLRECYQKLKEDDHSLYNFNITLKSDVILILTLCHQHEIYSNHTRFLYGF